MNLMKKDDVILKPVKNWFSGKKFVGKEKVRIDGPWDHTTTFVQFPTTFYDWQKDIINYVKKEPNDREILWISDRQGCKGKTILSKYLIIKYDACLICQIILKLL